MTNQNVACIPIALKNRQEIATALVDKYGTDYLFLGRVFQSTVKDFSCAIKIGDRNASLTPAFAAAAKIPATTLNEIDNHQQVIYLSSVDTDYAGCVQFAQLIKVFLSIGGIAVKLESAGIAHTASKWLASCDSDDVFDIYSLYVALVEGENNYFSCGMQNFGKADVAIALTEDLGMAIYVMNVFNYYRLTESPILQDGHSFQPDIESPSYQIKWLSDREYEPNSSLCNSHGRWHLKQIGDEG